MNSNDHKLESCNGWVMLEETNELETEWVYCGGVRAVSISPRDASKINSDWIVQGKRVAGSLDRAIWAVCSDEDSAHCLAKQIMEAAVYLSQTPQLLRFKDLLIDPTKIIGVSAHPVAEWHKRKTLIYLANGEWPIQLTVEMPIKKVHDLLQAVGCVIPAFPASLDREAAQQHSRLPKPVPEPMLRSFHNYEAHKALWDGAPCTEKEE